MNQKEDVQAVLNDQDRMEDLLTQEKYLLSAYGTFIPEAACPQLRTVLTDNFTECVQNQYTIFDKMSQLGWYPVKNAQKFQQLQRQL
ncbi:MAG: spore coat protein [Clostridia bacterium]